MRILAIVIFACCMTVVVLNLEGCARSNIHPSTPSLRWQD
jgi:hypothetical protein